MKKKKQIPFHTGRNTLCTTGKCHTGDIANLLASNTYSMRTVAVAQFNQAEYLSYVFTILFLQFVCNFTFEKQWMAEKKRWQRNCRGFGANVAFTEGAAACFQAQSSKAFFRVI